MVGNAAMTEKIATTGKAIVLMGVSSTGKPVLAVPWQSSWG